MCCFSDFSLVLMIKTVGVKIKKTNRESSISHMEMQTEQCRCSIYRCLVNVSLLTPVCMHTAQCDCVVDEKPVSIPVCL